MIKNSRWWLWKNRVEKRFPNSTGDPQVWSGGGNNGIVRWSHNGRWRYMILLVGDSIFNLTLVTFWTLTFFQIPFTCTMKELVKAVIGGTPWEFWAVDKVKQRHPLLALLKLMGYWSSRSRNVQHVTWKKPLGHRNSYHVRLSQGSLGLIKEIIGHKEDYEF